MEAEASGSDRDGAEQDDIEQHAPGGRRAGPNASSAAANGHRREGEDNADADVAVRLLPGPVPPCSLVRSCLSAPVSFTRGCCCILVPNQQGHRPLMASPTAVMQNDRDGKREDWEHEEERQDDDVDMEGEEAEDGDASPAAPRWAASHCLAWTVRRWMGSLNHIDPPHLVWHAESAPLAACRIGSSDSPHLRRLSALYARRMQRRL